MDVVTALYRQVMAKDSNALPIDIINNMCTINPTLVKIASSIIPGETDQQKQYSSRVEFNKMRSFVATDAFQQIALEKAAQLALGFLTQKVNIESKEDKGGFSQGELAHAYDEELVQILAALKAFGYELEIEDRPCIDSKNFNPIFHYTFAFAGFGKFYARSTKSRLDAFKKAATLLKNRFVENFSSKMISKPLSNGISSGSIDKVACKISNMDIMKAIESWKHCQLQPTDFSWINTLNQFKEVYAPGKRYDEVMKEMLALGGVRLSCHTVPFNNSKGFQSQEFKSCLYLANLSLVSSEFTEKKSRDRSLLKGYSALRKLSKLFVAFKSLISEETLPFKLMDELASLENSALTVNITNLSNLTVQTTVEVLHLTSFRCIAQNQEDSMKDAFASVLAYMRCFASFLHDVPQMTTTESEECAVYRIDASLDEYRQLSDDALRQAYEPLLTTADREIYLPMTLDMEQKAASLRKLVGLINHFNKVYDINKSPTNVIETLMESDRAQFEISTVFNDNEQLHVSTLKSLDLGTFNSAADNEAQSRSLVIVQAYEILVKFSRIFSTYMSLRSPTMSLSEYMPLFLALNHELVKCHTVPKSSHVYATSLKVETLHIRFEVLGNNAEEAEEAAFKCLAKVLDPLSAQLESIVATINAPERHHVLVPLERSLSRRPVPIRATPIGQENSIERKSVAFLGTMKLIQRFIAVRGNGINMQPIELMNELIDLDKQNFKFVTTRKWDCRDRKTAKRYQTVVKVEHLCSFTTMCPTRVNSKNDAIMKVYDRLLRLSKLVLAIMNAQVEPTSVASIDSFCWDHRGVLTVMLTTIPSGVIAAMKVVNFGDYQAEGANADLAKVFAFRKLASNLLRLIHVAQREVNEEEAQVLAALNLSIALATRVDRHHTVDASLALRVKLVRTFQQAYREGGSANAFLEDIVGRFDTSIISLKTTMDPDDMLYNIMVNIADVGLFYAFNHIEVYAKESVGKKVISFFKDLVKLIMNFRAIYGSANSPSDVIEKLQKRDHYPLLKIIKFEQENFPADHRFITVIQIAQMRTFCRAAASEKESTENASISAVDYLLKLTRGTMEN